MDLTEAEDIKKRLQEYTEPYKKDLHELDTLTKPLNENNQKEPKSNKRDKIIY